MTVQGAAWVGALPVLATQVACFLAVLLSAAAVHKISQWHATKSVVRDFVGLPKFLVVGACVCAVGIESASAAALVFSNTRAAGAVAAAVLWTGYLALLLRAMRSKRRDADCGCSFGMRPAAGHRPLGVFQIVRNGSLVILASLVAAASLRGRVDVLASQLLAALALLAIYAALDQVMAVRPLRSGELVR